MTASSKRRTMDQQITVGGVNVQNRRIGNGASAGSLEATREATKRWAAHDLSTKKELHAAVLGIIQKATSIEQVEAIGLAIAEAILVSKS